MAARKTGDSDGERGAVLIQVTVALLALLALSAFVFDYGVMWASRGQAQNAADAGALSGAVAPAPGRSRWPPRIKYGDRRRA